MKWISVKTKRPKDGQKVFVTQVGIDGHNKDQYPERVWLATYQAESDTYWAENNFCGTAQVHCVVNWMPLPKAPLCQK